MSLSVALALCAGLIPALFWLWFWLREDRAQPEPYWLIAGTFVAGMAVVPLALPLQRLALEYYVDVNLIYSWVLIEEVLKYVVALLVVLWSKAVDEPIDFVVYMITIALGFSALENALFLLGPLQDGQYLTTTLTSSFRFVGATLLHVLASGTVGVCMAFAFYRRKSLQVVYGTFGLVLAIVLHALFNVTVMDAAGDRILVVFLFVWTGMIVLLLLFERIKALPKLYSSQHNTSSHL